jgi:hypothetical protein
MNEKYKNESDIHNLVTSFEDATILRGEWTHAEHLIVALAFLTRYDLETATNKMRSGLMNLLENGFKVDLSKEMPYHETLTIFWVTTLADHNACMHKTSLSEMVSEVLNRYDKHYPLRFYSRETLFSDRARACFVKADIQPSQAEPETIPAL